MIVQANARVGAVSFIGHRARSAHHRRIAPSFLIASEASIMSSKTWLALVCLVAGVPMAAYGLAHGPLVLAIFGIALVLTFWFLAWQWIAGTHKPMGAEGKIKPAANAAWSMKDKPLNGDKP